MKRVVEQILEQAEREGRDGLLEHEVYRILEASGLEVPRFYFWPGAPGRELPPEVAAFLAEVPSQDVVLRLSHRRSSTNRTSADSPSRRKTGPRWPTRRDAYGKRPAGASKARTGSGF